MATIVAAAGGAGLNRFRDEDVAIIDERAGYYNCKPIPSTVIRSSPEHLRVLYESVVDVASLPAQTTWLSLRFRSLLQGQSRQTQAVNAINAELSVYGHNLSTCEYLFHKFSQSFGPPVHFSDVPLRAVVYDPVGFMFAALDPTTPTNRLFCLMDLERETMYRERHEHPSFELGELAFIASCSFYLQLSPPVGALLAYRHHTVNSVQVCEVWIYGIPATDMSIYATIDEVAKIQAHRLVYVA